MLNLQRLFISENRGVLENTRLESWEQIAAL